MNDANLEPKVYFGQFGTYQITDRDRWEVRIYRTGLLVAALCFAVGTGIVFWQDKIPGAIEAVTPLYIVFCLALGVSLLTIHIYMAALHRLLQAFWLVGFASAIDLILQSEQPFALAVYDYPNSLWGIGFTFAALTGIFFKEAFCFDRFETKFLTPLIPILLLGHLTGWLPEDAKPVLLGTWAVLFFIFAARKIPQSIPSDIGDKSVFEHLRQIRKNPASET
ncbi:hypothetical protein AY599_11860 [Leptolyngbya valderiana BDU 20041]|uniref:DUF2301 domain-containing membrane protein n=1 Tax=Baaleninema simplex TaxID=2862350 RepID=UPI0003483A35|nr:DUF2301 domain-containing membrane protein [Baaleninema simplex]MDC0834736.1 DUF2301 domain-containing membrane protein [Geitlerinema sp. CS-897]OAB58570.1 hypothetical protein AY599_11860 [Leptolyngbya valderiana BDU 20041]PPT06374.1 Permeases of the major facilitator superfamily [Geitlerinema sp. FC II]